MKKFYSILMASAVALSASALSIETADFGAVQDFTMPEGIAPAKTLANYHKLPASGVLPAIDLSGKKIVNFNQTVNPKSRVLGGFEGDVADYTMLIFVDYFEEEQMAASGFNIKITKEATDDADAEIAISGFLPVDGVTVKGTMSSTGEIVLPSNQVLFEQQGQKYVFEAMSVQNNQIVAADAIYYTYDDTNNVFAAEDIAAISVYNGTKLLGQYGIWMAPSFVVPNGAFIFAAQKQNQEPQQLGSDIYALVQHEDNANVDICYVFGLSPIGDSFVASFEVVEGGMYAYNSKCFPSPNFGTAQSPTYFNDFMIATYDETLKSYVFPVVATYEPEMGINSETNEKVYDVYSIPMFGFVDPYYNVDLLTSMGYMTGDFYIFLNKDTLSGVEDVVAAPAKANARYYNIQGMEVNNPTKGQLLIEKTGDTSRKIIF